MTAWTPNFGYKMAWLAIKNTTPEDINQKLQLPPVRTIDWDKAMDRIYENDDPIVLTPQINGWSFIIGRYLYALDPNANDLSKLKNNTEELSIIFEEVQAFATHRVSEYHHWILAKKGKVERCFAYSGEKGKVFHNEGELTEAEKQLPRYKLKGSQWYPNEEDVMTIAGKWSINPTKIEGADIPDKACYIANIPSLGGNHPT